MIVKNILICISKSLNNIKSASFIKIAILCIVTSLLIFVAGGFGIYFGLNKVIHPIFSWSDTLIGIFSGIGTIALAWFLLPAVVPLIATLFQEYLALKIEKKEYPNNLAPNNFPILKELVHDLQFLVWMLFLNILCIPLYFIPIVNIVIYYFLNSYLLGREFFEDIAAMHIGKKQAKKIRKQNRMIVLMAGSVILFIINLPVLNLVAPLVAVILMVHLFHKIGIKS